jgi:hypothetical protein
MSDKEVRPDSGILLASQSKKTEKSPDYYGEITVNLADMTKITKDGNLYTIKLSGWKRRSKAGNTFLSLAVDRWIPKNSPAPQSSKNDFDEDVPF